MSRFDLVVIGGGPAGYVPAIRAAQLGRRVAVVEQTNIGGTCLNRGCIPTKAFAATAELLRAGASASRMGLSGTLSIDFVSASKRKDMIVTRLRKGIEARLSSLGIELVRGRGVLKGPGAVDVEGRELAASFILLSPGSRPFLPGPLGSCGLSTSDEALEWKELPASLIIVGGGVIGCEFASFLSAFGVDVTIVEMLPGILPGLDDDVRKAVHSSLARAGVRIHLSKKVESAGSDGCSGYVTLEGGERLEAASVLVAAGRVPVAEGLGLEEAGVAAGRKGIEVDAHMRTTAPGIYAAGDVTGRWQLAHAASAQALAAVDHMFGDGRRVVNPEAMPSCIFTNPEVAVVGPGEEELEARGVKVEVRRSRYIANGRAVGLGETEGFVKLIARASDGVLLGAQIVGREASSLIGEAVLAVEHGMKAAALGDAVHPHPTLTELIMEAGEAFGAGAIHG